MQYLLKNDRGAFVSDPNKNGTGGSYTRDIRKAKRYETREIAEMNRCPGNEYVTTLDAEIKEEY